MDFFYTLNIDKTLDPNKRANIKTDMLVEVVEKQNQSSGELTEGLVKRILTNAAYHPHGIKVKLDTGEVGRVRNIIEEE